MHALQPRPDSPDVELIVREFDLDEVWDSCMIEQDDENQEQTMNKLMEKESMLLERKSRTEEEPEEDDMEAKEKHEYAKEIKKIWEVTLGESDTERYEDNNEDSEEEHRCPRKQDKLSSNQT
jgi:hypothetical protein